MTGRNDLTALLGSRICHDLISPLGAISNGLELLSLSGLPDGPEMRLIAESVASANAKIRFFRVAYGAAAPDQMIAGRELRDMLAALYAGGRIHVDWDIAADVARREARLAFLALQCLETAMPRGGHVQVTRSPDLWQLTGNAARLNIVPALWNTLAQPGAHDFAAAEVHFALAASAARELGRNLRVSHSDTQITISF